MLAKHLIKKNDSFCMFKSRHEIIIENECDKKLKCKLD